MTFEEFKALANKPPRLRRDRVTIGIEYKYKRVSRELLGLWYTRKGKRFSSNLLSGFRGERISLYHICFAAYFFGL